MNTEYFTKDGAAGLAGKIMSYWNSEENNRREIYGKYLRVWVEKLGAFHKSYSVTSNMVNGYPPAPHVVTAADLERNVAATKKRNKSRKHWAILGDFE